MKNIMILLISLAFSPLALLAQEQATNAVVKSEAITNGPVAKYDRTVYDFGEIVQNSPGTASFTLTNNGNEPLIIASATASCGCTNLSYEKDPVLPNKSVTISATYNAASLGNFTKNVTVKTNAGDQPVILTIKGKVIPK
jgi:hypothetical protein